MNAERNSGFSDWRRRAHQGSRDIAIAVMLTVTAAALIGVAWLGGDTPTEQAIGPSAAVKHR